MGNHPTLNRWFLTSMGSMEIETKKKKMKKIKKIMGKEKEKEKENDPQRKRAQILKPQEEKSQTRSQCLSSLYLFLLQVFLLGIHVQCLHQKRNQCQNRRWYWNECLLKFASRLCHHQRDQNVFRKKGLHMSRAKVEERKGGRKWDWA